MVTSASITGCSLFGGEVAATVNGEKIYASQVDEQYTQMQGQLQGKQDAKMEKQFKQRILDKLISDALMMQGADELGIKPTDKEIEDRYAQLKKQFATEAQFNDALQKAKLTPDRLKESIKQQIVQQKVMAKISKNEKISDKKIADFYKQNKAQFVQPEKYHVLQVLVAKKDKKLADKVYTELKGGATFAAMAKKYSIDPQSKQNGGDIGFVSANEVVPEFGTVVQKLKPNEISKPFQSTFGWHIIEVVGKRKAGQQKLSTVKEQIRMTIEQMNQRDAFQKWLDGLRKKAKIEDNGLYK
jgi:foldase protein PrsA